MPMWGNWLSHSVMAHCRSGARRHGQGPALRPLGDGRAGDLAEGGREVDVADGLVHLGRRHRRARSGAPHERHADQGVHVVRALEQQAEVTLELAVVGGEHDVGVVAPAPLFDAGHAPGRAPRR